MASPPDLAFVLQQRIETLERTVNEQRAQIVRLKNPQNPPTCADCGKTAMGRDFYVTVYGMTMKDLGALAERAALYGNSPSAYLDFLERENTSLQARLANVCEEWARIRFPDTTGV